MVESTGRPDTGTMTAIGFHEHGDIDQYELLEVPIPSPEPDEVLVEVHGAGVNHQDLIVVRELERYVSEYPFWGGGEISGTIAELGDQVTGWSAGDRVIANPALSCESCEFCKRGEHSLCANYTVYGEHRKGGFAEYVTVPARNLFEVPDGVDLVEVAAAPMAGGTAWRELVHRGRVQPYEDVLILGATGGVGTYGVQIAKEVANVDTLYATTSTEEKAEFLRDLGADHVINYTEERFDQRVWELTDKRGVDLVVNNVGGDTWVPAMRSLTMGGRMVTVGATAGPNPETEIRLIFVRQLEIIGSTTHTRAQFDQAMGYVMDGTIEPVIQAVMPFEDFPTAFEMMDDRELFGKIVLTPE